MSGESKELNQLKVKTGSRPDLEKFSTESLGSGFKKDSAEKETHKMIKRMDELQSTLYAGQKHSLLIVLQGVDGAGKDSTVHHVLSMNPQGCQVTSFKEPSPEELRHDFLWRIHPHAPAKGHIAVFNRSHYEDVLVARVHQLVPEKTWLRRYEMINEFERVLNADNETTILKFFLHISKAEQLRKFKKRLDDPARNWKIAESDYADREHWDDYVRAYEDLLGKTSTPHAPWFVIPSDHKWMRDWAIARIVTDALENLSMKLPRPAVDLAEIRRKYHDLNPKKSRR